MSSKLTKTPLHIAAEQGDIEKISELTVTIPIESIDSFTRTPLMHACRALQEKSVKTLLTLGAKPNAQDAWGNTAASFACSQKGGSKVLQTLLNHGADINLPDEELRTPLHKAFKAQDIECVDLLLSYGADPNAKDRYGKTPMQTSEEGQFSPSWFQITDAIIGQKTLTVRTIRED